VSLTATRRHVSISDWGFRSNFHGADFVAGYWIEWWLAGFSEQERYFFTCKEAKYVKGRRANRATGAGYWKATGKEKPVAVAIPAAARGGQGQGQQGQAVLVGMKRSLVFYRGKPPTGSKTDWVMHEYRLAGAGLSPCRRAAAQDGDADAAVSRPAEGWVLCRVFRKKKGSAASAAASPGEDRSDGEEARESESAGGPGFIDFFARADAAGRRRRAASPVVSSSCLTDASPERQQGREQETTSRGA
jgi:hypothetical protein